MVVGITVIATATAQATEATGPLPVGEETTLSPARIAGQQTRQEPASVSSAGLRWFLRRARNVESRCNRGRNSALSVARR